MIDALRALRRPTPEFGWRVLALHVGPALLLLATVLPLVLFQDRLPGYPVPPPPPHRNHEMPLLVVAVVDGAPLVAGWATAFGISFLSGEPRRRLLAVVLPLLYALGGMTVVSNAQWLARNLDQPYLRWPAPDAFGAEVLVAAAALGAGVGLLLARRVTKPVAARPPAVRAVWVCQVDADLSWWLLQAAWAMPVALLAAAPPALNGSWGRALEFGVLPLAMCAAICTWASRGHVAVTAAGVRVRWGRLPVFGWELGVEYLTAVDVRRARVLRSLSAWIGTESLCLRTGPALVLRTRWGERWVTVPEADDAAAVLRNWIDGRRAIPAGAPMEGTS
jgi:hypothetical protein